jgi:hypothetical protein
MRSPTVYGKKICGVDSSCLDASTVDGSGLAFASTRRVPLRVVVLILTAGSTRRLLAYCKMDDEFKVEALTFSRAYSETWRSEFV